MKMSVIPKRHIKPIRTFWCQYPECPFVNQVKVNFKKETIPPENPPDVDGAAFTQLGLPLSPLRSPSSGVFSPPEFILWHYKDVHWLADNGDDIFSPPHNDFPVFCSGQRLSSQATAAQVLFFFPTPVRRVAQLCGEMSPLVASRPNLSTVWRD